MDLLLLCAGAGKKDFSGDPVDRPLRTKGKRQAQKIGAYLGREGLRPEQVVSSNHLRSRVSAEKSLKAAGWTARDIGAASDIGSAAHTFIRQKGPNLVVAPASSIRTLVRSFGLLPELDMQIGAGVLLCLKSAPEAVRVLGQVNPKDLPDHFPYPAPDGPDRRERPAYYYHQSAVIPVRRTGIGTEVLIVRSSSGRYWTIPKGIVEPGLSPSASAAVEAREEAGVAGSISSTPLGHYRYAKWGAACEVTVFSMDVTTVLTGTAWEERHRGRTWLSPLLAAERMKEPALRDLILSL
ncbi:NUDIX domain-containing protein [Roseibium denhamense]|uniref:Phosphohistidine phosphatase n=1 Tax=Roseibium denhamense TaxID=76305 RepID=A0ABY1PAZ8_9HYPH|nr:NUDIX domain-containing protein [Roseibium denhamense]SMP29011.1 phosphohistidine phosphatase [Roseibium denhamense]